jgi:hypothetical protein
LNRQAFKADLRTAETLDKAHGRIDARRIETLSKLPSLINFPGAAQIGRIHRERVVRGVKSDETVCFVTSLPRLRANAKALLQLSRSHWSIENGLHWVRDVTFGEDACTVTSGDAPQLLAAVRNACAALLRKTSFTSIASAIRSMAAHPAQALAVIGGPAADY